jgi:hypothetical protein
MKMMIDQPHGYLRDSNGDIVIRFANWRVGNHDVPDVVDSVDYVSGPSAHDETVANKYLPDT